MSEQPTLIVMARTPVLGQVKTRIAATLGPQEALAIYHQLLDRTAAVARQWAGPVAIHVAGDADDTNQWSLAGFPSFSQSGSTLGDRMAAAMQAHLERGPAVMIGTDCPGLSLAALTAVADLLSSHDVAIGPAIDGGYWCLGLRSASAIPAVCADTLPWSQPDLLTATKDACAHAQLSLACGPGLDDCDTEADYQRAVSAGLLR